MYLWSILLISFNAVVKTRNSDESVATKKALQQPPPQKVDCYQYFQEFEKKKTIKIHLPEYWQINLLLNYFCIL